MNDLDEAIRRSRPDGAPTPAVLEAIEKAVLDALPSTASVSRGQLRRRFALTLELAVVAGVVVVLALLISGVPSDDPASSRPGPSLPAGWRQHTDSARGMGVAVPPGWSVAGTRLAGALSDPHEILAMGTGPMVAGGPCGNEPTRAIRAAAPRGAFVTVQERSTASTAGGLRDASPALTLGDYAPRPRHFDLGRATSAQPTFGCAGLADVDVWWIPFRDGQRAFYLLVALGDRAPASLRATTQRVVDSLTFAAGRTVGMGPWARVPPGWSASSRSYQRRTVLQVATIPLPGRITDDLGGQQSRLGAGDIQVSVVEFISRPRASDPPSAGLPVRFNRADFEGRRFEAQTTTALAERYFRWGPDTLLRVNVALGPADAAGEVVPSKQGLPPDADTLINRANQVVATLVPAGRAAGSP